VTSAMKQDISGAPEPDALNARLTVTRSGFGV